MTLSSTASPASEPNDTPGPQRETSPRRGRGIRASALLLIVVAPLLPTLRAAFVYDDTTIIRDNVGLRGWGALTRVWSQPYWPSDNGIDALGLYRPLHIALLSSVWNASGGSARWFHIYALGLVALTALAVWWMLGRAVRPIAAFVAAAWFASHPLHVEAVASVANTSELLMVLCTVGLIHVLREPLRMGEDHDADWRRAVWVGALAAAALLAKESGLLAVPIAGLTAWGWRKSNPAGPRWRVFLSANARAWAAALVGIVAVLLARSVALGTPVAHASIAAQGLDTLSAVERVRAMMSLWPRIAGMILWPTSLSPYYGPTSFPANGTARAIASGVVVASVLAGAAAMARRGDRRPLVAVTWIALTYFPASNLAAPTGQILSDRTLMGATVGVAFAIAWALDRLPRIARVAAMVLCGVVVARAAVVTTRYAVAWTSHRSLWTRMIESEPREHLGYKLLGIDARARGDTARALELLARAFAMAPADGQIRFEYGQVLYQAGRYRAAVAVLGPLSQVGDALAERGFVSLYLDAVGRASGPAEVVKAATRLVHSQSGATAALFLGLADEQLGKPQAAESAFALGLRRSHEDSALTAELARLRARGR